MNSKSDKIDLVQEKILIQIADRGIEGVSITDLSRSARVSRAWIYKFLGNKRSELIHQAAIALGKRFSEMENPGPLPKSKEEALHAFDQGSEALYRDTLKMPWLPILYFAHRSEDNPIGSAIRAIEKEYIACVARILQSVMGFNQEQSLIRSELLMELRMMSAHRWAKEAFTEAQALKEMKAKLRIILAADLH